jgi:hypothetical protein
MSPQEKKRKPVHETISYPFVHISVLIKKEQAYNPFFQARLICEKASLLL